MHRVPQVSRSSLTLILALRRLLMLAMSHEMESTAEMKLAIYSAHGTPSQTAKELQCDTMCQLRVLSLRVKHGNQGT